MQINPLVVFTFTRQRWSNTVQYHLPSLNCLTRVTSNTILHTISLPSFISQQLPGNYFVRGFDYLVVVDFEATCEEKNAQDYPHEIIEFPAVLIDVLR